MDGDLGWDVQQVSEGHVHVMPTEDTAPHIMHQSCPCHVKLEMPVFRGEDGELKAGRNYIHNAWDGRR
ncbi:hypothetical protein SEA_ERUTAN_1 [Gordonia phage Erutan]|uniref:Uncharacterized protein n=1 Tax=Gordonia phage Erutan TaxID=3043913 RepID=A0AA96K1K0_9CAUD|nr:hypothetical protein SEA_ERUTAN_1 [Gordonia phage Erutan]